MNTYTKTLGQIFCATFLIGCGTTKELSSELPQSSTSSPQVAPTRPSGGFAETSSVPVIGAPEVTGNWQFSRTPQGVVERITFFDDHLFVASSFRDARFIVGDGGSYEVGADAISLKFSDGRTSDFQIKQMLEDKIIFELEGQIVEFRRIR